MTRHAMVLALVLLSTRLLAALSPDVTLEKAKDQVANGLYAEAKSELIELLYSPEPGAAQRAEARLLLGNIGQAQGDFAAARQNWQRVVAEFPGTEQARVASEKLSLLDAVAAASASSARQPPPPQAIPDYPAGTVLVVADPRFGWAAVQIAGELKAPAVAHEGSLADALRLKVGPGVVGVSVDPDSAYESARVTCHRPSGQVAWEAKQIWHTSLGEDRIAHDLVGRVAKKIKGKSCP